jgi:hypothetical protein
LLKDIHDLFKRAQDEKWTEERLVQQDFDAALALPGRLGGHSESKAFKVFRSDESKPAETHSASTGYIRFGLCRIRRVISLGPVLLPEFPASFLVQLFAASPAASACRRWKQRGVANDRNLKSNACAAAEGPFATHD